MIAVEEPRLPGITVVVHDRSSNLPRIARGHRSHCSCGWVSVPMPDVDVAQAAFDQHIAMAGR